VHTLLCRGTCLPLLVRLSTARSRTHPFARPLLELAGNLLVVRPRVIRLDASYREAQADRLDPHMYGRGGDHPLEPQTAAAAGWSAADLDGREVRQAHDQSIGRFCARILIFFRLQRPPVFGWSAVETRVALTYSAVWVIALAAWQEDCPV
jgi:hypothetical protein